MKSKEELNALKEDVETLNNKLAELNDEELEQVTGGHSVVLIRGKFVTVKDEENVSVRAARKERGDISVNLNS